MAMLNNQMVSMLPSPMDPAVPSERKWDWDMVTRRLYKYLLRQWPWIHRDCCQLCKFTTVAHQCGVFACVRQYIIILTFF